VSETERKRRSRTVSNELPPEVAPDRLLTDAEAAELLAVPKSWVGEAARAGRLPHMMLGRYRRFDRADLLAWREEQKTGRPQRRPRAAA
jgi:excisionase family DNA binding protein